MIADHETNTIYFSEQLRTNPKYSNACRRIANTLDHHNITYDFLPNTKDIWARDYMPIQVASDKFIEYRYDPDYLQSKKGRIVKTYPDIVCDSIGLTTIKSNLILDGGNVIKSNNCAILTDKILFENKEQCNKQSLLDDLRDFFEVDSIVLIPWDKKHDYFGHADGMLRFIDEQTVLIQEYFQYYSNDFKSKFFNSLATNGLKWEELKNSGNEDLTWAYINFLQTRDIILVPSFGISADQNAFNQINEFFPDYEGRIEQVDISEIVNEGGGLNCISWTIKN